jgi:hypothetical protein
MLRIFYSLKKLVGGWKAMVMVSGKATGTAMAAVMGDGDRKPTTTTIMLCQKSAENQQGVLQKVFIVTIVIGQIL